MRDIIQAQQYVPPWDLDYLNSNGNARQRRPSINTRNEYDPGMPRIQDQHRSTNVSENFKQSGSSDCNLDMINTTECEISELNYVLMRENIEKFKRIKILKQVKSIFNDVFTRVQDITDSLKIQLDEVMKEHRKANKMIKRLHSHISGMQDVLCYQCNNELMELERDDIELAHDLGRTSRRLSLPAIESANSSRPCSLPDVFKVDSSDQSPGGEDLRVSKTRNIRKIAEKKSHEKSLIDRSSTRRMRDEISTEKHAFRERNRTQTLISSNSKSSAKSTDRQICKRINEHILLLSESGKSNNAVQPIENIDYAADKAEVTNDISARKKLFKDNCVCTDESMTQDKEMNRKNTKKTSVKKRQKKTEVRQKHNYTPYYFGTELVNRENLLCNSKTHNSKQLPKLQKEQIVEKIRSIEECIIRPNRHKKDNMNTSTDEELSKKKKD